MTETLRITVHGTENNMPVFSETGKQKIKKFWSLLTVGNWILTLKKEATYKKSRYRYLFSHVYLTAVTYFNRHQMYQLYTEDGEVLPLTVEELHDMMKQWFNPIIRRYEGMKIIIGGSTRKLSDQVFISEFLEKILCFLAEKGVICLTYQEWRELAESKEFTSQEIADEAIEKQITLCSD